MTDYTYDATHGGVLTVTAPAPGGSGTRPAVRMTYAQRSAWYKNAAGSIVSASAIYRLTAVSACQTGSAPSCVGTADEVRTTIDYGTGSSSAANNLLPVSVSSGAGDGSLTATTASAYDAIGNVTSIDGPLAGSDDTTGYRYDADRRPTMIVSPDPDGAGPLLRRALQTTYDGDGRPTLVQAGTTSTLTGAFTALSSGERVSFSYDSLGRKISEARLSGTLISPTIQTLTQYSYDTKGRPECNAVRMNPATFASPPSSACSLATTGSFGPDRITRATYDNADQVTKVETGYGTSDAADEMQTTYRNNGQVETVTDANGNKTTYAFDGHDRLSRTRMPDPSSAGTSSTTDYEELTYVTAAGGTLSTPLVASRRLRDGNSIAYSYDALSRLSGKDLPGSELDVTYGYDLLGRTTSVATSAQTLSLGFDALGRNTSEGGPHGTVSYGYDLADRRTSMTYPDSGLVVGYAYDVADDLTEIRENPSGSNTLLATYAYDDRGRRTSLTRGNGAVTGYGYDNVSRLNQLVQNLNGTVSDVTFDYSLNPAGEIVSTARSNDAYAYTGHANANVTGTANGLNQLTAVGGVSNSHDSRGNVSAIGSNSYGYSSENLLTSGPSSATFSYDPANRLDQTVGGGTTTRFGYDGGQLIGEYSSSNALQRRFVFGPGVDEPLVWYEGSGTSTPRYFHADERGSEIAVSDGSGDLYGSNPNRYDEYGNPQGSLTGRFGYTGQAWLPEIGMAYYRARIYNPAMGRFMQTDPSGFDGGMNIYAYVGNNPVNATDSSGLGEGDGDVIVDGPNIYPGSDLFFDSYMFRLSLDFGGDQRIVVTGTPLRRQKDKRGGAIGLSKYCVSPGFANARSFIRQHRSDAQTLATYLDTRAPFILGHSGQESGWGTGSLIRAGTNNYFGLTDGPAFRNADMGNFRQGNYVFNIYRSYLGSGASLALSYIGARVRGTHTALDYARAANRNRSFNSQLPPGGYENRIVDAINVVNGVLACPGF